MKIVIINTNEINSDPKYFRILNLFPQSLIKKE